MSARPGADSSRNRATAPKRNRVDARLSDNERKEHSPIPGQPKVVASSAAKKEGLPKALLVYAENIDNTGTTCTGTKFIAGTYHMYQAQVINAAGSFISSPRLILH